MQVKLRDVKGLIPEIKPFKNVEIDSVHSYKMGKEEGYNFALTQQGSRAVTLNRERLAKYLHNKFSLQKTKWDDLKYPELWLSEADSLNADLPNLLEAVTTEKEN